GVILAVIAVGFVPILLSVIDMARGSRALVDLRGFRIDFSQTDVRRRSTELPANVGEPGQIVTSSSPTRIAAALGAAMTNQFVRLDIKDGDAWWVTRLFALSAGAVRMGVPKAIVFVGNREGGEGMFLGWAFPSSLLKALTSDNTKRGPSSVSYGG